MAKRRRVLVFVSFTACAVLTATLATSGSAAMGPPRCDYRVDGPLTRNSGLASKATFRCVIGYRHAQARVALQRRVNGHWTTLAHVTRTLNIVAGRNYSVRASVPCHAALNFTGVMIRTFFTLRARGLLFELPTHPDNSLCLFG